MYLDYLSERTTKPMSPCLRMALNALLENVKTGGADTNAAVSPLSLEAVVAMMAVGCSGPLLDRFLAFAKSGSLEELKSRFKVVMRIANCSRRCGGCPEISFANGVWVDKRFSFKDSYQQCITDTFKSRASIHDFINQPNEVVKDINSWVESQSKGRIEGITEEISPLTTVILANALYFKGKWLDEFDVERSLDGDFCLINGDKIPDVIYMTNSGSYRYGSFEDFQVLEIPYQTGKDKKVKKNAPTFSMQFILPKQRDGLQNLLEKFEANGHDFELEKTFVNRVWIPKFKFCYTLGNIRFPFLDEEETMMRMMTEMFEQVEGGTTGHPFYPRIVQKVFVEVNEEGTEAVAVTSDDDMGCPLDMEELVWERKVFEAKHPFMFIIKEERSGLVLFTGVVMNPLKGGE